MRFFLWDDGNMPPPIYITENHYKSLREYKDWEKNQYYHAYAKTTDEARQKAVNYFHMYIAEHGLQDYCFIQWRNNNQAVIPCFGDERGDYSSWIAGTFREQKEMDMYIRLGGRGFRETTERI